MFENIIYFFQVGGWTMYAIAFCSILTLAVFLERAWTLKWKNIVPKHLSVEVEDLIKRGDVAEAITRCKTNGSPLSRLIQAGLEQAGKSRSQIKEVVFEVGRSEGASLEKYLPILSTIVVLAPMLGFLGTGFGMVQLFSSIAEVGEVTNVGVVADGIYKALYTTIAGLTVAIPATIFYKYLSSRVDRMLMSMEEISMSIIDKVIHSK